MQNRLYVLSIEYNLDYSAMYKVVSGKLKSYKGWIGEII